MEREKPKYQIGDVIEFCVGGFGVIRKCEWVPNGPYYHYATSSVEGLPQHPKEIGAWFRDTCIKGLVATSVRQIEYVIARLDVQEALAKIKADIDYDRSVRTTHGVAKRLLEKQEVVFKTTHQIARELLEKNDRKFERFVDEEPVDCTPYLLPDTGINVPQNADEHFMKEGTRFHNEMLTKGNYNGFCPVCRTIGIMPHPCRVCGTIIPYANA